MNSRMKYIHSFQKTQDYVIVPETSYLYDPCTIQFRNSSLPDYKQGRIQSTEWGERRNLSKKILLWVSKILTTPLEYAFASRSLPLSHRSGQAWCWWTWRLKRWSRPACPQCLRPTPSELIRQQGFILISRFKFITGLTLSLDRIRKDPESWPLWWVSFHRAWLRKYWSWSTAKTNR